jgi:hypothetical protein
MPVGSRSTKKAAWGGFQHEVVRGFRPAQPPGASAGRVMKPTRKPKDHHAHVEGSVTATALAAQILAPRAGFEPATIRLTVECSTAELPRNRRTKVRERAAYNKAFRACKGPNHRLCTCVKRGRKAPASQRFVVFFAPRADGSWNQGCAIPSYTGVMGRAANST